jgi:glucose/arabinose dehydrogenase
MIKRLGLVLALCAVTGCGGGGGGSSAPAAGTSVTPVPGTVVATPTPVPTATPGTAALPTLPLALDVNNLPGQFYGEIVGTFSGTSPRELTMLPNGDLLVGTGGGTASFQQSGKIYIIPNAEGATPGTPAVFATLSDIGCSQTAGTNTNGITFAPGTGGGTIFVGMECSVWKIPYLTGDHTASSPATQFLAVRTGSPPNPAPDSDVHHTTSVLAANNSLYISVGSDCNACIETDSTRAVILKTGITSPVATTVATRVRNALALAVNPATNTVWAGGAGQDCMVGTTCFSAQDPTYALNGHPYEWMDPLTKHTAPADYMWPWCEENNVAVTAPEPNLGSAPPGTNCSSMIVAPVRAPAYATIMAATFYAPASGATYAFPSSFNGGMFMTLHGSWHENASGIQVAVPEVVFVPMSANDVPTYAMNWTAGSPYANWARNAAGNPAPFMNGFQQLGTRVGRPVGLAVGPSGSLFISDDSANQIYRIRPGTGPQSVNRVTVPSSALRR